MLKPCLDAILLLIEAQKVVELRLVKLAWGGLEGCFEAQLMVTEKVSAAFEALGMLMAGRSSDAVIARYREHVAANRERLSAVINPGPSPQLAQP